MQFNSHVVDYYIENCASLMEYGQKLQACGSIEDERMLVVIWGDLQRFEYLLMIEQPHSLRYRPEEVVRFDDIPF